MSLRKDILECETAIDVFAGLCTGSPIARTHFSLGINAMLCDAVKKLRVHNAALDRNECHEVLGLDFRTLTEKDHWLHHGKVKEIILALNDNALDSLSYLCDRHHLKIGSVMDIYQMIERAVDELVALLKDAYRKTLAAPLELFGNFFHKMKSRIDEEPVMTDYQEWKMDVGALTFDILRDRQTFVVAEFLKKKILRFTQIPSDRERELVVLDKVRPHLPHGYELPEEFTNCCARFRRFISWDGDILRFDYGKWGKYLYKSYYDLTEDEIRAFLELDIMLGLIHQDMRQLSQLRITPETMAMTVEKTMAQGYWWASTAWAVVYSVYQTKGYAGSISQFVREVEKWPLRKGPIFPCTYDAVQKTIASGKLSRTIDKWIEDGATVQIQKLGQVLLDLLN